MVIADTSVWIEFFNRPHSKEKHTIDALIDDDVIVLTGIVLAELLQGCRTSREWREVKDAMQALRYLEMSRSTWTRAGEISSGLLRRGITLPMSDLAIAALALEHDAQIYSLNAHFQRISSLALYAPSDE